MRVEQSKGHHNDLPEVDTYLVAVVNKCMQPKLQPLSENTSIVMDELDTTATRRRVTLLRNDS